MPAESSERFIIRSYRAGDEQAILDLFARSFHQPQSIENWHWKYQHNPYGRERISLAFDGDRLVGHYAGYAVPFILNGARIETNQVGDTMTDPSIRHIGRGPTSILGRTALHFYEHFCEGRVAFNYGFNVANIQKFSLRFLRSERVEPVAYRSRDLRTHPFPRVGRLERWARGVSLELARVATAEWDQLFQRAAPHYGFLIQRDAPYVRWRYLQSPKAYSMLAIRKWRSLAGWIVFLLREDRLVIGDMLLDPDHVDAFDVALRHLTAVLSPAVVEMWCPSRPRWLDNMLRNLKFEISAEPQNLSVMCVPFTMREAVDAMRSNLFYTMGDSDLF